MVRGGHSLGTESSASGGDRGLYQGWYPTEPSPRESRISEVLSKLLETLAGVPEVWRGSGLHHHPALAQVLSRGALSGR